ncbi:MULTISPECIES: flavodoxin family protein [Clostridia]|uniref:Flavodoxin family protein n=1 Tax=Ruminococcus hominis TaxID=2763065 RepID=A0ABR7G6D0_9FIRM|nr:MULTISPECIES: flavodoxin family protein [Clostridia]MBC5682992.1 flavodoxin family protein [Ruminococcus hominis]RHT37028.1 flavodoxin family protein [Firmicutes bacterium AM31-12AC]RKQ29779.1 flavodoxin family protein [Ruminococcus sp. B05]TAP33155.1 flavodoxin family protein [Mediterraneibacter sp. gm002]
MSERKKVLGLNFGRVNGNCKGFLKEAIKNAEAQGAEVEIIDTMKKEIKPCIGCGACSRILQSGKGQIKCCQKDDYEEISDAVLAADAIIVAAPVYVLAPTGQFKNFVDRFGPAHDKAYMLFENELRKDTNGEELNPDCLKRHLVSYISVGGATTQNWVSYGIPGMNLFGMSLNMKVVDQLDAYGSYVPDNHQRLLEKSAEMGKHIVEALDQKTSEIEWTSDPGTCPVCHCNEMTMTGTTKVSCPICGIYGKLVVDGDDVKVEFSEEEKRRSRLRFTGVLEHQVEQGRKDRYPRFDEYVKKFQAMQDEM